MPSIAATAGVVLAASILAVHTYLAFEVGRWVLSSQALAHWDVDAYLSALGKYLHSNDAREL